jgi:hypothetical protein
LVLSGAAGAKKEEESDDDDDDNDLTDVDVSRLIIVTQSRHHKRGAARHDIPPPRERPRVTEDLANVINDGLYYYERELQVGACACPHPVGSCGGPGARWG